MKIYILSLKRSVERRKNILQQFKKYNIDNYEFIDAYDWSNLDDIKFLEKNYDFSKAKTFFYPLNIAEIACAMGHIKICKKILDKKDFERSLIIEDDAILTNDFAKIKDIELKNDNIDILFLGVHTSLAPNEEYNNRHRYDSKRIHLHKQILKLLKNKEKEIVKNLYNKNDMYIYDEENFYINHIKFKKLNNVMYQSEILWGMYAYSPNRRACEIILKNLPVYISSDNWLSFCFLYENEKLNIFKSQKDIIKHPIVYINRETEIQKNNYYPGFLEKIEDCDKYDKIFRFYIKNQCYEKLTKKFLKDFNKK
jgi:GR25 family glycosyltransferase involved in LPS biosynthesis